MDLDRLRSLTEQRQAADEAWKIAVIEACKTNPIRTVATAAGVSHQRVHQILHNR